MFVRRAVDGVRPAARHEGHGHGGHDTAPPQVPAHQRALLPPDPLQPDHHAEPARPPDAGGGRPGGAPVLPARQDQLQRRLAVLLVLRVLAGVHDPGEPAAAVPQPLPVGQDGLRESDAEVRVQLAGDLKLRQLSGKSVGGHFVRRTGQQHLRVADSAVRLQHALDRAQTQEPLRQGLRICVSGTVQGARNPRVLLQSRREDGETLRGAVQHDVLQRKQTPDFQSLDWYVGDFVRRQLFVYGVHFSDRHRPISLSGTSDNLPVGLLPHGGDRLCHWLRYWRLHSLQGALPFETRNINSEHHNAGH